MEVKGSALKLAYGNTVVVHGVDVDVCKSKITTIIGPNGSGKSTVLKGLTRLLDLESGCVYIGDKELKEYRPKELARILGVLPQKHIAPPDFKVKDLVGYGRMPYQKWHETNKDEDERVICWAMKATDTWHLRDKSIQECSGGEAQRIWIAMVLTQQPEILFLDEPTTYLDIAHQMETMRLVKKLNRESNIGVVMVLHNLSQAMEISDWIVVVKSGTIYSEGPPAKVINKQMMKDVYNVDCDIVHIPGREKPIIAYSQL